MKNITLSIGGCPIVLTPSHSRWRFEEKCETIREYAIYRSKITTQDSMYEEVKNSIESLSQNFIANAGGRVERIAREILTETEKRALDISIIGKSRTREQFTACIIGHLQGCTLEEVKEIARLLGIGTIGTCTERCFQIAGECRFRALSK